MLDDPEVGQIAGFGPPEVLSRCGSDDVLRHWFMNKTKTKRV